MEATYTCNEGYEPAGTAVLACQVDGQWNGVAPTCMCECLINTSPDSII